MSVRFAGYAAVFDRPDRGGDIIRPGAFAASAGAARATCLCCGSTRPGAVIGRIEHLCEDKRGLRVIARAGDGEARRRRGCWQSGKLNGLSFGYRVREASGRGGRCASCSSSTWSRSAWWRSRCSRGRGCMRWSRMSLQITESERARSRIRSRDRGLFVCATGEDGMMEVKADALEQSFEAFESDDGVAALKDELALLKAKIASGVIAAQRPALDGVKSARGDGVRRRLSAARDRERAGDRRRSAVRPTRSAAMRCRDEIDEVIDRTLMAISPIRADRQCRQGRQRRLSQAGQRPAGRRRAGSGSRRRGRRPRRRPSPRSCRRRASFMPIRRRRSRCSTMRCSMSRAGSPTRSRPSSRAPRAWRSSRARACSQPLGFLSSPNATTVGRRAADGHAAVRSAPARRARSRRPTRRTS